MVLFSWLSPNYSSLLLLLPEQTTTCLRSKGLLLFSTFKLLLPSVLSVSLPLTASLHPVLQSWVSGPGRSIVFGSFVIYGQGPAKNWLFKREITRAKEVRYIYIYTHHISVHLFTTWKTDILDGKTKQKQKQKTPTTTIQQICLLLLKRGQVTGGNDLPSWQTWVLFGPLKSRRDLHSYIYFSVDVIHLYIYTYIYMKKCIPSTEKISLFPNSNPSKNKYHE